MKTGDNFVIALMQLRLEKIIVCSNHIVNKIIMCVHIKHIMKTVRT